MEKERESVAAFMRRLYERQLTSSCGGNVSLRYGNVMLITASSTDKAVIDSSLVGAVDIESARNLTPQLRLSIETEMHRAVYLQRPDVMAVVHSHPLYASLFASAEEEIDTRILAESYLVLGRIVRAGYALMGTEELARNVAEAVKDADVVLMQNHGALTAGTSLLSAFEKMEVLERTAKMNILSGVKPHVTALRTPQLEQIREAFA